MKRFALLENLKPSKNVLTEKQKEEMDKYFRKFATEVKKRQAEAWESAAKVWIR